MKSILFFLFAGINLTVAGQHYQSSCQLSENMEAVYRNDAYKLAVKRLHQTGSSFADSVIIPEIFIGSIVSNFFSP